MSVFDGLPMIFTDTFGEAVTYAQNGQSKTISAVWIEAPIDVEIAEVMSDDIRATLSVMAGDVPAPKEGDVVTRLSTGAIRKVTTPIRPDGKGMITVRLALSE